MKLKRMALMGAVALLATPLFAGSYYGGLEDWNGLDYDYNDVVFSLNGSNLMLHSTGNWFTQPALGTSGTPFWNHSSLDAPNDNVGFCIYGGGSCNGGTALFPNSEYLAANPSERGSANDVTFTADGQVTLNVALQITMARDVIGWYSVSNPGTVNWLNPSATNGSYTFTPGGAFGLAAQNAGYSYYSQSNFGSADYVSHFAFFGTPSSATPEPASLGMLGIGLVSGLALLRKRAR